MGADIRRRDTCICPAGRYYTDGKQRKEKTAVSRLDIMTPSHAQTVIDGLYRDVERRIAASPPGLCPVDLAKSFLDLCHAQTCGKCVPCRIGLGQLSELMEQVLEGEGMDSASFTKEEILELLG